MLTTETRQFARVLADKLAELTDQRQGRDRITIETSADEVEECLLAAERDIVMMDPGRLSSTCRQIQAALKRVCSSTNSPLQYGHHSAERKKRITVPFDPFSAARSCSRPNLLWAAKAGAFWPMFNPMAVSSL